jgi:hypothetical protein
MSQVIELKDEVYTKLKANADKRGVSPEVWIEIIVEDDKETAKLTNWKDFIGASSKILTDNKAKSRTDFGKAVAKKLQKQGLKLEYDSD